ncbi:MAG TPA: helix-turn-helix domain-containing protein, partial [Myxococcota bacterium]|nr:helix-turn-helix domain-containing protein [Myxococcota bacterium]
NVRELENYMERAVALAAAPEIRLEDLPEEVRAPSLPRAQEVFERADGNVDLESTLQRVEKQLIDEALRRAGGVKTRAAELLGLSFRSLRYRLQKLGYSAEEDER